MAIEIVDFPINSMVIFHSNMLVHQRVLPISSNVYQFGLYDLILPLAAGGFMVFMLASGWANTISEGNVRKNNKQCPQASWEFHGGTIKCEFHEDFWWDFTMGILRSWSDYQCCSQHPGGGKKEITPPFGHHLPVTGWLQQRRMAKPWSIWPRQNIAIPAFQTPRSNQKNKKHKHIHLTC